MTKTLTAPVRTALTLADFELIVAGKYGGVEKHPGQPYVGVFHYNGLCRIYLSDTAATQADLHEGEGVRFAMRDDAFYLFRVEAGSKGSYKASKCGTGTALSMSSTKLFGKGLLPGDYMLLDPINIDGFDLFEIVKIEVYEEVQADKRA